MPMQCRTISCHHNRYCWEKITIWQDISCSIGKQDGTSLLILSWSTHICNPWVRSFSSFPHYACLIWGGVYSFVWGVKLQFLIVHPVSINCNSTLAVMVCTLPLGASKQLQVRHCSCNHWSFWLLEHGLKSSHLIRATKCGTACSIAL